MEFTVLLHIGVGTQGGARGGALAPPLSREGGRKEVSAPPHFWARTYLKIPPRSLFFHPHNSTVLTPNQSVRRCFDKFIGVGTGGAGDPAPPPVFLRCVCEGGWPVMLEAPSGQFFSVQRSNILHNHAVCISLRTNPRAFPMQEARSAAYFTRYTNLFGSLGHQAGDS